MNGGSGESPPFIHGDGSHSLRPPTVPEPPLTGYPLPGEAYTDDPVHTACMLPPIMSHMDAPLRLLPLGARWRCGDCELTHVVVMTSLGRAWEIERVPRVRADG